MKLQKLKLAKQLLLTEMGIELQFGTELFINIADVGLNCVDGSKPLLECLAKHGGFQCRVETLQGALGTEADARTQAHCWCAGWEGTGPECMQISAIQRDV